MTTRKINEKTGRVRIPDSKLEDSELSKGDEAEIRVVTSGRNAGRIYLEKPGNNEVED